MRRMNSSSARRALVFGIVAVAMVAMLVAPAVASAASMRSTLLLSTSYQAKAAPFTASGQISSSLKGKRMTIEIRKPGRAYWLPVGTAPIGVTGKWKYTYTPKLGGKFYVRARGGIGLTRTAVLTVAKGPGKTSEIRLSSTTSTRDSGLFERIGPAFLAACPEYTMKAQFVGSGTAIQHGGDGNADVLLTHSPAAEVAFMNGLVGGVPSTYRGKTRYKVMYNDYVLVGPTANPAGVSIDSTAGAAFNAIATYATAPFWSRNDNSGTNAKEKEIWASIGNPQTSQSWYKASGTMGMAQALAAANDASTGGYTLADRGTWLNATSLGTTKNLKVVNQGDANYRNQYSVITVGGALNGEGAADFSAWLRSAQAQQLIATYGEYTYPGQILFIPNAGSY